ncbi:hypothetical protein GGF44_004559, partial [Coemansia sp. RSA 1694]
MEDRIVQCGVTNVNRKINQIILKAGGSGGGGGSGSGGGGEEEQPVVVQYYKWFSLIALDTIGVLGFG